MTGQDVVIAPSRTFARYWVLRVAPSRYYKAGGSVLRDGHVSVGDVWTRRIVTVPTAQVAAVVCALVRLRRGDWRVLLVDSDNRTLARTTGLFYSDQELQRLAGVIGCAYRRDDFASYRKLDARYPGSARRWEQHVIVLGLTLGLLLVFSIYGIPLLFGAR